MSNLYAVCLALLALCCGKSVAQPILLEPEDGPQPTRFFGVDVAFNEEFAFVGATRALVRGEPIGAVYVFRRDGGTWVESGKLLPGHAVPDGLFGYEVEAGDGFLVAAHQWADPNGTRSGAVYIYEQAGETWTQSATLIPDDARAQHQFGVSVAVEGDVVVVGTSHDDTNGLDAGAAYVFRRSGHAWIQEAKLIPEDNEAGDQFGNRIAIDGDAILIGTYSDRPGAAYVFRRQAGVWTEEATLKPDVPTVDDTFGMSVAISGDYALVGDAQSEADTYTGTVYVFRRTGGGWVQESRLLERNAAIFNRFGWNLRMEGDLALITAPHFVEGPSMSESTVYLYRLEDESWTEQVTLSPEALCPVFGFGQEIDFRRTDGEIEVLVAAPTRSTYNYNPRTGHCATLVPSAGGAYFFPAASSVALDPAPETLDALTITTLAPNPAQTTATLGYTFATPGPVEVTVFDLLGRAVYAETRTGAPGENRLTLSTAGFKNGTYVVRLAGGGRVATRRFTVAH